MINPGDIVGGFFVEEGRCFRMIASLAGQKGQTTHCSAPAVWRGRFVDARGKVHRVWSCDCHADDLVGLRRVNLN
jgi:hypothetical protein